MEKTILICDRCNIDEDETEILSLTISSGLEGNHFRQNRADFCFKCFKQIAEDFLHDDLDSESREVFIKRIAVYRGE